MDLDLKDDFGVDFKAIWYKNAALHFLWPTSQLRGSQFTKSNWRHKLGHALNI